MRSAFRFNDSLKQGVWSTCTQNESLASWPSSLDNVITTLERMEHEGVLAYATA